MKHLILISLTGLLISTSCGQITSKEKKDLKDEIAFVTIEISEQGLFLNSKKVDFTTTYNEIKSIIGPPTKEQIQSASQIEEVKGKTGLTPSNIYTYDNYGVLFYQNPGENEIESISINFKKTNFSYSPSSVFEGILKINGVSINQNTSLSQLKKIEGLDMNESIVMVHPAEFNNHALTFEFNSHQDKNGLAGFSIVLNNVQEQTNEKGWTEEDISMLKVATSNNEELKKLSTLYNFKVDDFVNCYARKVSTTLELGEMHNPTTEMLSVIEKIMQDCIILSSNIQ